MEVMLAARNAAEEAEKPTKVFLVLSVILGALLGLFFLPMLFYCFADTGEMLPLLCFFLPLAALGLWCASKGIDALVLPKRVKYAAIACGAALLLMFQLRLAKALYGNIAYDFNYLYVAARGMAWERTLGGCQEYFARFPNNLFLALAFAAVIKVATALGITNLMAVLTGCSLVAVDLSILLLCLCARKMMGNKAAWMALLFSIPLIFLHYGIVNPYSDTFGMLFPIFLLFLYLYCPKKEVSACLVAALMGLAAAVGYKIKPQTVILAIAIGLTELFYHRIDKKRLLLLTRRFLCFVLALALCTAALNACMRGLTRHVLPDELRAEKETPFTHYLMMGLNPGTGGFISEKDYAATNSFSTKEEKIAYNLRVTVERLSDLGILGYGGFLLEKGRHIFHSIYMDMWVRTPFPNEDPLSKALQQTFCQGGAGFSVYIQFLQALWILLFLLWVLPLFFCRESYRDKAGTILRLSIMGLTAFQLLFEAGARYRFHQFPIFILLAVWGMQGLPQGLRSGWNAVRQKLSAIKERAAAHR